ncbi:serine hydrolase domain-containing protein [Algibacter mikhailovii]|nr:serine hydrolase [Algibacter mikhailovii]
MKTFKWLVLFLVVLITIALFYNYPKLNMLSGYSAKNTASSVFVANRTSEFTDETDNNFFPVNLASDVVDIEKRTATASAFGLLTRKAIHRKGLGTVLTLTEADETSPYLRPKRLKPDNLTPYPYGNAAHKDTVFPHVNYEKLNSAVKTIFQNSKTRAVVILHKDRIIAEKYAEGFSKDAKILGWSMTKSILSTVFGVMQHQGKLNVYDKAPIASWQNDERQQITIHNLLQMNSGLEWEEDYDKISDVTKMLFLERDMTKLQEHKPLVGKPNESWNYSSGTTNLLSGILRKQFSSHQAYLDFWYTDLIDKIGMNSMVLEADLSGNYIGSSYAWATARDWAKFGLLYLHNGDWNGQTLFTKSWVDYVSMPTATSNGTYGAQFWLNANKKLKDVPANMYFADGFQGQRVYVLPDQDMVVVRFGLSAFNGNKFLKDVIDALEK